MRIIFVRHAESTANLEKRMQGHADYKLSSQGMMEAKKLRDRFKKEELMPTHIYSSPLLRTLQTANIAAENWNIEVNSWDKIIEHDVGVFSNLTWPEIQAKFKRLVAKFNDGINWDLVEGAESYTEIAKRARSAIKNIVENHSDKSIILIFTHGGIMQHLISVLLKSNIVWKVDIPNTAIFDFNLVKKEWMDRETKEYNPIYYKINRFCDNSHIDKEEIIKQERML